MNILLSIFVLAIAIIVFGAAVCRLVHINVRTHKLLWVLVYALAALGALTAGLEATQFRAHWPTLILLFNVGLALWGSRVTWRDGAPKYMEK